MEAEQARRNLMALRDRLTGQRSSQRMTLASESGRFTARAPSHMAEQASESQELEMLASRLNSTSESIALIDDAIDRIDAGLFNVCEECKGEIGDRRLTAQPWARLCINCQRALEGER